MRYLPLLAVPVACLLAWLLCLAVNPGSLRVAGWPVFGLCVGLAFVIQWLVFIPAYIRQSEKLFDLTGSVTYAAIVVIALVARGALDVRSAVIGVLVLVWAVRLGSYLAMRIHRDGFDRRFNSIKRDFPLFLMTWTLQATWVTFGFAAGMAAMTAEMTTPFGIVGVVGVVLWIVGFAVEVAADRQKQRFRADPDNAGRFITTGLWARSRHPNYFGEIVLWLGIAVLAYPALRGWQYVTLLSPVFVTILLTKISGVRMLEARARKRWGDDEEFAKYSKNTPMLVPRLR